MYSYTYLYAAFQSLFTIEHGHPALYRYSLHLSSLVILVSSNASHSAMPSFTVIGLPSLNFLSWGPDKCTIAFILAALLGLFPVFSPVSLYRWGLISLLIPTSSRLIAHFTFVAIWLNTVVFIILCFPTLFPASFSSFLLHSEPFQLELPRLSYSAFH